MHNRRVGSQKPSDLPQRLAVAAAVSIADYTDTQGAIVPQVSYRGTDSESILCPSLPNPVSIPPRRLYSA